MARRVVKETAHELIAVATRLDVTADLYSPSSRAAYEFYRQMSSNRLKKSNPAFECVFHDTKGTADAKKIQIKAVFSNNSVWEVNFDEDNVNNVNAIQLPILRQQFFDAATAVAESLDDDDAGGEDAFEIFDMTADPTPLVFEDNFEKYTTDWGDEDDGKQQQKLQGTKKGGGSKQAPSKAPAKKK